MSPAVGVGGIAVVLVLVWGVATWNRFVRLRQHIRESWSDIDVELKRRHDLIPNLVETVKGYAEHERETLERVVRLRNQAKAGSGGPARRSGDEIALLQGLKQIFALAEAYPELQADEHFRALQRELTLTEDRIAAARRFYNGNVRTHEVLRQSFPTALIGRMAGVEPVDYFELPDELERVTPPLDLR